MQRRNFGKGMWYLVVVGTLVSSFAMFACGGGDNTQNVTVTVPLTSSTVVAVQNVPIAILDGQLLGTAPQSAINLVFTSINGGLVQGPGGAVTAPFTVVFGQVSASSCTFNVQATPGFINLQTSVTFTICNLL